MLAGRSVCWCCIRLVCATCLMCLVVTFELSIFLASCLTLLAENLSRSIVLSFMVLDTNSSSLRKNQKYLCKEPSLSLVDTWPEQPGSGQHYTIHPLTCFPAKSLLEGQTWPSLHLTRVHRILHTFPKLYQG